MEHSMIRPPEREPVTPDEGAEHLGGIAAHEEFLLSCLLVAARVFLEGEVGRVFITQGWQVECEDWPRSGYLSMPRPLAPLISLDAVQTFGRTGWEDMALDWFTLDTSGEWPQVVLRDHAAWTAISAGPGGVALEVTAGYGEAPDDVPEALRIAIMELAGHWFENREPIGFGRGTLPVTDKVRELVAPHCASSVQAPPPRRTPPQPT